MLLEQLSRLLPWVSQMVWTLVAVLSTYLIGRIVSRTVGGWLSRLAAKTHWKWDEVAVESLGRGIPVWSMLIGVQVAVGFWQLPEHALLVVNRITYAAIWLSITLIFAGLAGRLITLYGGRFQQAVPVTSLTQNITKLVIVMLGLLMILNGMGISIAPLLTALGIGGLAVALALQDTLSNLFAGFYLTVSRHIRVGDYIKLESGEEGYVDDIAWRATKLRMLPNNMVLVPNNKLGQAIITNYYLPNRELAVLVEVGAEYGSDLERVERVTSEVGREVMRTVQGGVPEFEPLIRYHAFGDFSVKFTVILRAKEFVDQYLITHEFIKRLHARYQKEGIVIPFPTTRTVMTNEGA